MKKIILLSLVLVSLGFGVKLLFFPSDKEVILNLITSFKEKAQINEPLQKIAMASKSLALSQFFSKDVKFIYNGNLTRIKTRDVVKQKAFLVYSYLKFLKLENSTPKIEEKNSKIFVTFKGKALWQTKRASQTFSRDMTLKLTFQKEEKKWKVFQVENVPEPAP